MSIASGPRPLAAFLSTRSPLLARLREAAGTADAAPALTLLPPALAARTTLYVEGNQLILQAENNAAGQLLRFHGERLAHQAGLAGYQVRVRPQAAQPPRQHATAPAPELSAASANALRVAAEQQDYPPLADALRRLAAVTESEPGPSNTL